VASVAIYTTRPMSDVRSIALDTSSRTSVALVSVLCARLFRIAPRLEARGPDLREMLAHADAALIIGDNALFLGEDELLSVASHRSPAPSPQPPRIEKIDLGSAWTAMTGLPFVYAFWAGRPDALGARDVEALARARDAGVRAADAIARAYFPDAPLRQAIGARYLRDNIKYDLGAEERAALEMFYRYAAEAGVVKDAGTLRFF
jgi:chorismate dehydratase